MNAAGLDHATVQRVQCVFNSLVHEQLVQGGLHNLFGMMLEVLLDGVVQQGRYKVARHGVLVIGAHRHVSRVDAQRVQHSCVAHVQRLPDGGVDGDTRSVETGHARPHETEYRHR